MARLNPRQYQRRVAVAMVLYVGLMLLAWPTVRTAVDMPLKVLLALAPLGPMFYMIGLMARRIFQSDELEQRTHLVALGVATAVVGALSLAGGFLAAAKVLQTDGSILIWVFPVMTICYGITRWWVGRRYGMTVTCEDSRGTSPLRFLLGAMTSAAVAWLGRGSLSELQLGVLCGMSGGFLLVGLGFFVARRLDRRAPPRED
ncbi:MAG TPA: hypothetical protein VGU65_02215 [Frateuria sp.]|uniref:hypothetical protein n=1 Tax=Frateuria sp. TaxID=2211372 RepID=UPI002DF6DB31|nr:hypothetical protein [Frateuria sp.]